MRTANSNIRSVSSSQPFLQPRPLFLGNSPCPTGKADRLRVPDHSTLFCLGGAFADGREENQRAINSPRRGLQAPLVFQSRINLNWAQEWKKNSSAVIDPIRRSRRLGVFSTVSLTSVFWDKRFNSFLITSASQKDRPCFHLIDLYLRLSINSLLLARFLFLKLNTSQLL